MKLNILLCDRFPGLLPEYIPSYESMFIRLFERNCERLSYEVFYVPDGEYPDEVNDRDVYLITGCNLGVYDDVPWIKRLLSWIAMADSRRLKVVGICFGHQAVAQALGGRVERSPKGWGTGVRRSVVSGAEALRRFPKGSMCLMYNHHDQVVQLPPKAVVFASSDFCPVDGFYIGSHIITFQGHPEYVPQYNVHLIVDFAADEPAEVKTAALRSIGNMEHEGDAVAKWIEARFAR